MRSGYKITLSILTIMILVTIAIGTSYAFFSVSDTQSETNTLSTTCFSVSFTDGDSISLNENGSYAYPMSDASAEDLTPYTFTIRNECGSGSASINYKVILSTFASSTLDTGVVKYSINTTNTISGAKLLTEAGTYMNEVSDINDDASLNTSKTYILIEDTLAAGAEETYYLRLWIDESAGNGVMGQTFTGKLFVYSYM